MKKPCGKKSAYNDESPIKYSTKKFKRLAVKFYKKMICRSTFCPAWKWNSVWEESLNYSLYIMLIREARRPFFVCLFRSFSSVLFQDVNLIKEKYTTMNLVLCSLNFWKTVDILTQLSKAIFNFFLPLISWVKKSFPKMGFVEWRSHFEKETKVWKQWDFSLENWILILSWGALGF